MPTRPRWSPSMTDTAREYFDRAMQYLIQDFKDDAQELMNQDMFSPTSALFEIYCNKAAQLGRDLAEDIQTESTPERVLTPTPDAPYFTHDCNTCVYLGSGQVDGQRVDFYRHPGQGLLSPTALARTGNDGPDYGSMPESMLATWSRPSSFLAEYKLRFL